MNVTTALLFFLSGFLGGYSLLPKQYYYVYDLMSWSQAQSYCKEKYTELVFVYSEEDIDKLKASRPPLVYGYAWIGGYDMKGGSDNLDSQNITESDNTTILSTSTSTSTSCLVLDVLTWKRFKRDCKMIFPFYCSRSEGKRVVLRMQVKPDGQVDIKDPVIRANMLAKINEEFNKLGFGNAVKVRWLTRRERPVKKSENNTCTLDTL